MAYKIGAVQFSDGELYRPQVIRTTRVDGMTAQEIAFTQLNNTAVADLLEQTKAKFTGKVIATPPPGFAAITVDDFEVYLNGRRIPSSQINSILQQATPVLIEVDINISAFLDIPNSVLEEDDEVVLVGKFN